MNVFFATSLWTTHLSPNFLRLLFQSDQLAEKDSLIAFTTVVHPKVVKESKR